MWDVLPLLSRRVSFTRKVVIKQCYWSKDVGGANISQNIRCTRTGADRGSSAVTHESE